MVIIVVEAIDDAYPEWPGITIGTVVDTSNRQVFQYRYIAVCTQMGIDQLEISIDLGLIVRMIEDCAPQGVAMIEIEERQRLVMPQQVFVKTTEYPTCARAAPGSGPVLWKWEMVPFSLMVSRQPLPCKGLIPPKIPSSMALAKAIYVNWV